MAGKAMTVKNESDARIILGAPPRSKTNGRRLRAQAFDTPADDQVPEAMRIGRIHEVDGHRAAFLRQPKISKLVERLGLRVSGG